MSTGYFRALEIPLFQGRLFEPSEERDLRAVVVNRAMADRFWPGENPLGKRVRGVARDPHDAGPWLSVVGVVGDIHHMALDAPGEPEMFTPFAASPARTLRVAVRSPLDLEALGPAVAHAAAVVDVEQAVSSPRTMREAVYAATSSARLSTVLLSVFAAVALVLAVVGLYGVVSYMVDQRTQEIGLRMALGAQRGDVLRMVLRDGLVSALVGVAVGLGGAYATTRLMTAMLFGVSARDAATFLALAALLIAVAAAAAWVPAHRATGIDPVVTLRS